MTSTTEASNNIYKESEFNIYKFNEQNVIIDLDKDDAFINAITSQLSQHFDIKLSNKDVVLYKLPDAKINFNGMCRICLATTNVKYSCIFDIMYEGALISNLLMELTSVSVQQNDMMPKDICDTCITELINCYQFKKKCLQSQSTLEKIIKYSVTRQGSCWNDTKAQTPFILHNCEYIKFLIEDETEEQKITQIENCREEEPVSNLNEKLNGSSVIAENEEIVQNNEEGSYDINLLPTDLNASNFENEEVKDANKQIKYKLPLSCSKCGDNFQTLEELQKHRKVRHPSIARKFACQVCGKLYARNQLELHLRTHTKEKPFECRVCSRAFSLKMNLNRHFMIHTGERPHVCHICGKGFIQSQSLRDHMCTHTGQKPILCDVCGKGFSHSHSFSEHKCDQPSSGRTYKCSYCGTIFSQYSEHRKHMQQHRIDQQLKKFWCDVCQKVFNTRKTLNTHMLIHGEKTYLCSDCGNGFHTQSGLLSHMKMHTGVKPHSCSECGNRFLHFSTLKTHMLMHTGERPYTCEICLRTFVQKTHLNYHLKRHYGDTPYKCSYCNKSYALKGTLRVHTRIHTGETPYICDVCGRKFNDSTSLKKHKRAQGHIIDIVDETSSVKSN